VASLNTNLEVLKKQATNVSQEALKNIGYRPRILHTLYSLGATTRDESQLKEMTNQLEKTQKELKDIKVRPIFFYFGN
jgi:hypothetical protein